MKERLTNNLGLKILSVVIAVFMWLIMVNVSNPLVSDSQEVTVDMINAEVLEKSNLTYEIIGKKTVKSVMKSGSETGIRSRPAIFMYMRIWRRCMM